MSHLTSDLIPRATIERGGILRGGIVFVILLCSLATAGELPKVQTRSIQDLLQWSDSSTFEAGALPELFRRGDQEINELVTAASDPNFAVSHRAHVVLRYLANPTGMAALERECKELHKCYLGDPIPAPLIDSDFQAILQMARTMPLSPMLATGETYAYALALDGSLRSNDLLTKWIEVSRHSQPLKDEASKAYLDHIARNVAEGGALKSFPVASSLSQSVVANAFFLSPIDRRASKSRVMAMSADRNKALLEVHLNHGLGAQKWYRVVVARKDGTWHFVSISMFAQG